MLLARATTTRRVDECALSLAELSDIDEGGSVYFKNVSGKVENVVLKADIYTVEALFCKLS